MIKKHICQAHLITLFLPSPNTLKISTSVSCSSVNEFITFSCWEIANMWQTDLQNISKLVERGKGGIIIIMFTVEILLKK